MSRLPMDGTCPECGKDYTGVVPQDEGIGAYEYWGCKGVHHDWRYLCPECDAELDNLEPTFQESSND